MFFDIAVTAGATFPLYLGTVFVLTRQYDKKFSRLMRLFGLGMLSTAPLLVLKWYSIDQTVFQLVFGPLASILLLAFLEEFLKSLFLLFDKEFSLSYVYPIVIGIGFAFLENVNYLFGLAIGPAFWTVAVIRLLIDSTAHAVFTSIVVHYMRKAKRTTRSFYYVVGLMVSGSMHGLFNLLHHWEMNYLVIPLLVILIYWLHHDSTQHALKPKPASVLHKTSHTLPLPHT